MDKKCSTCKNKLTGRQRKFCSTKCKNANTNNKHQNYIAQQRIGYERKAKLLEMKGGGCELCKYSKNSSALCFHHLDPQNKSFQIDIRHCSNTSWSNLLKEVKKCQLLWLNCYAEVYNPSFST
jgi:hypothetical protein